MLLVSSFAASQRGVNGSCWFHLVWLSRSASLPSPCLAVCGHWWQQFPSFRTTLCGPSGSATLMRICPLLPKRDYTTKFVRGHLICLALIEQLFCVDCGLKGFVHVYMFWVFFLSLCCLYRRQVMGVWSFWSACPCLSRESLVGSGAEGYLTCTWGAVQYAKKQNEVQMRCQDGSERSAWKRSKKRPSEWNVQLAYSTTVRNPNLLNREGIKKKKNRAPFQLNGSELLVRFWDWLP